MTLLTPHISYFTSALSLRYSSLSIFYSLELSHLVVTQSEIPDNMSLSSPLSPPSLLCQVFQYANKYVVTDKLHTLLGSPFLLQECVAFISENSG